MKVYAALAFPENFGALLMKTIYQTKNIETPRTLLRPVQPGDEIGLHDAICGSLDALRAWFPWAQDASLPASQNFVERAGLSWKGAPVVDFPMVVIHKKDQKIIGASGYNNRSDLEKKCYEIGYWCDVSYQGQGLVTEWVHALQDML